MVVLKLKAISKYVKVSCPSVDYYVTYIHEDKHSNIMYSNSMTLLTTTNIKAQTVKL